MTATMVFTIYGSHLGSLSIMTHREAACPNNVCHNIGDEVMDSKAAFKPFGDYRIQPTQDISDRGFTGHPSILLRIGHENHAPLISERDLGLTYDECLHHVAVRHYAPELRRIIVNLHDRYLPTESGVHMLSIYRQKRQCCHSIQFLYESSKVVILIILVLAGGIACTVNDLYGSNTTETLSNDKEAEVEDAPLLETIQESDLTVTNSNIDICSELAHPIHLEVFDVDGKLISEVHVNAKVGGRSLNVREFPEGVFGIYGIVEAGDYIIHLGKMGMKHKQSLIR